MTTEKLMSNTEANTVMREFLKMVIDNTFENLDEAARDPESYDIERVRIPVFVADYAESVHGSFEDAKAAIGGDDTWEQGENTRGETVWRRGTELITLVILELELKVFNDRQKIHADARIARLQHDLALALARRTGAGVRGVADRPTRITVADYVQHGFWKKGKRGECRVYWDTFIVNDISRNAESGYSVHYGATGLAVVDASTQLRVVWLDEVVAAPPPASEQASKYEAQLRFANDEVKRYEERYRQERENALALANTLMRVAPDAYKELKPKLHQNVGEWDKQWSDATRWRRNAQEILWRVSAILEGDDDPEEKAESCFLLVERELDRLKEGNLPLETARYVGDLHEPPAPPPADSEDRQLATIARGIAETLEVYELPLSGAPVFAYQRGNAKYGTDLNTPHDYPFMEALRQLALWKAGQQVAEAGEAAPVDALAKARERITELEAEVARLQAERDSAVRDALARWRDNNRMIGFKKELSSLMNMYGIDNTSDTYDFVLADYLLECLAAFKRAKHTNEVLSGIKPQRYDGSATSTPAASTSVPESEATDA